MFLSWIGVVFARSYGSWERIKNLVSDIDHKTDDETRLEKSNRNITSEKMVFDLELWGKDTPFTFKKNSWTVFTGKTGHGKTHLIKQIAGALRMNKVSISYVAQDPYLYSDTIVSNIFLGYDYTSSEEDIAYDLLCLFGLDYLANNKRSLLDMEVGEKGKRLSGGQSKRLALVRSIMGRADVLLWDDPFSSVDVILEKQIIEKLKTMDVLINKTIILSTHRLTTVRFCENYFHIGKDVGVIEDGKISEGLLQGHEVYEYFKQQMV